MNIFKKSTLIAAGLTLTGLLSLPLSAAETAQAPATTAAPAAASATASDAININAASATEIAAALKGVGMSKAEAIVAFRELNGPFLQLEEITQVKGIGEATLEKNKAVIRFQ